MQPIRYCTVSAVLALATGPIFDILAAIFWDLKERATSFLTVYCLPSNSNPTRSSARAKSANRHPHHPYGR